MRTGVTYIDRDTRKEVHVRAKAVVLAAGCSETTRIMLNSKSKRYPNGVANSSGQLGKNLCDQLYGTTVYGSLPQLRGASVFPDSVTDNTIAWLPRWQNLKKPREEKFVRGYAMYVAGAAEDFRVTTQGSKDLALPSKKKSRPSILRPSVSTPRPLHCPIQRILSI